jgi:ubiquinone/menaquinone biosynthesis C-methylase UbiE
MSTDLVRSCLAAYDDWAATYDSIDNPVVAEAAVVVDERAAWFSGARVLELGCGTGRNAARCLAAGADRYVGVDASVGMLTIARRKLDDPRVSWLDADLISGAQRAMQDGRGFDVVLLCLVLEHIEDVAPVIDAAAAALARGGRLLIVELHPALHDRGVGANFRIGEREVRLPSFRHTVDELATALARAGLTPLLSADRCPTPIALARSRKLARYAGHPVVLEIAATQG